MITMNRITDFFLPDRPRPAPCETRVASLPLRQTSLLEFYDRLSERRVRGYNPSTGEWHCCGCGISMGPDNPRQFCEKWWCPQMQSQTQMTE